MTRVTAAIAYLVLAATVFAPVDRHGAELVHLTVHSEAVGEDLGVNVLVPPRVAAPGERALLVFLHGRGGDEETFNDTVFRGLPSLHGRESMVVAFPDGGDHGYWHNRREGRWDKYVMRKVIPWSCAASASTPSGWRPLRRALVRRLRNRAGRLRQRR